MLSTQNVFKQNKVNNKFTLLIYYRFKNKDKLYAIYTKSYKKNKVNNKFTIYYILYYNIIYILKIYNDIDRLKLKEWKIYTM